jgi:5-formyltetrahydrofolate cyclo-ligase
MPADAAAAKSAVRRLARRRRRELARELDRIAAGQAIATTILGLIPAKARLAAYVSLPDEPPTGPLIRAALRRGHEVIVPIVLDDFSLEWTYAAELAVGDRLTIARLPKDTPPSHDGRVWLGVDALAGCDLVVTPGLSVDRHGNRLGQGGGCYDRALEFRAPGAPVVALLHEGEQTDDDLPHDAHDRPVDGYVTTTGRYVRCDPSGTLGEEGRPRA